MKFYFDNNLSPHLARAMSELAVDERRRRNCPCEGKRHGPAEGS